MIFAIYFTLRFRHAPPVDNGPILASTWWSK